MAAISRRRSVAVRVGFGSNAVTVGGDNPIVVQSMTNTGYSPADISTER